MRARCNRLAGLLTLALLTGGAAVMHTAPAQAQGAGKKAAPTAPADAQVKDEAKKAFLEGNKHFKASDYAKALPNFQKADRLYPGAAPKHKIAICLDKLGRYEEAVAAYRLFVDSNPSEKYAERVTKAKDRIKELESTVPGTVFFKVSPQDLANLTYEVDGKPEKGPTFKLKPGPHTFIIKADGHEPATQEVTVKGATKQDIEVTLKAVEVEKPPPPPPPPTPDPGAGEVDTGGDDNIPAYVTLGIAGVGVVVGTIFGVQALMSKGDFDDDPTQDNADAAERNALIADMSFGVALTFGITGAVLLFTGGDDEVEEEAPEGEEAPAKAAIPKIVPYAGTQGGGVSATWTF